MDKREEGKSYIKLSSGLLIIYAVIYLVSGVILTVASKKAMDMGYGGLTPTVTAAAYSMAFLGGFGAVLGFYVANHSEKYIFCRIFGAVLTAASVLVMLYMLGVHKKFEYFQLIALFCGWNYLSGAKKLKEAAEE